MKQSGSLNYQWAFSLINHFSRLGISQAVISPGSRSTPLALACEKHNKIQTWLQIDERSAGFFALGLAQQKQQPVILVCTSGSAVANWLPAVVEANHSYTALILLSADRPKELQNCGANQTIDQKSLFASQVRDTILLEESNEILLNNSYLQQVTSRAYKKSLQDKPGPVHINIPFKEPLLPKRFTSEDLNHFIDQLEDEVLSTDNPSIPSKTDSEVSSHTISPIRLNLLAKIINSDKGLIICGRLSSQEQIGFAQLLVQLTKTLNCPALIDPLSNCRFTQYDSSHFIYNYDHFLKQHHITGHTPLKPDWIIRFGQFPVSKNCLLYLQSLNCHSILVSSYGDKLDPIHKTNTQIHSLPSQFCQKILALSIQTQTQDWLKHWLNLEKKSAVRIQDVTTTIDNTAFFEGHIIHNLLKSIPDNSFIFSGNSMAIRDFDTFITHNSTYNKKISLFANRGVSGIDGNLSTFFGLLANQKDNKKSYGVALVGDLTFYHDMNGLLICKQLSAMGMNAAILLINNSGGVIFNYLPQQQLDSFDKLWTMDTGLDFKYSAKLYGLNYTKINNKQDLEKQLPLLLSQSGIQIIEVIIDQKTSVECHNQL
ncbi:MAG: 2-succinyl-5-enolpyruvyl-6-hydroxy-3-cyclohexene-1-carboxylic-acid synthase [gamma proteobacterium symbiont of Taylorina sp.]|nr:2-succinyl-5-enolpyruvyl-6-hydroxy-3-cyclohexene-1-carboxylic-acid synthase [gamma proteobacterium symbiont of Taylorina sp.]